MSFDEETPREDAETEPQEGAPDAETSAEQPEAEQPEAEQPEAEQPEAEQPEAPAEDAPDSAAPEPEAEQPAGEAEAVAEEPARERPRRERRKKDDDGEPEVIPGAHLEPDLVLEDAEPGSEGIGAQTAAEIEAAEAALAEADADVVVEEEPPPVEEEERRAPERRPTAVLELAADARYFATGKRKSAVARVMLKPGTGVYTVNGRELERFFPRPTLQKTARDALETVGQQERMDVIAQIHGGGVSAQAGALRHGVARALVEADPNLRGELKRRGFLTRDPRVKERKKAGLKKARKRPQFSKR